MIKLSLSLNDSLSIILAVPMDIISKIDTLLYLFMEGKMKQNIPLSFFIEGGAIVPNAPRQLATAHYGSLL